MTPTYALLAVISLTLSRALAETTIPGSSPAWTFLAGERKLVSLSASASTHCPPGIQDGEKGLSVAQSTIAQLKFNGTSLIIRGGGGRGNITLDGGVVSFSTKDTGDDAQCSLLLNATSLINPNETHVLAVTGLEKSRALVIAAVQIDGTVLPQDPGTPPENAALEMRAAPLAAVFFAVIIAALLV